MKHFIYAALALTMVGTTFPAQSNEQLPGSTFKLSGLSITRPSGWLAAPVTSRMRAAEFSVPPASADVNEEPGQVVFFHFPPGDGGAVDANVRRWIGQFQESPEDAQARTAVEEDSGLRVTFVAAQGTYNSGIPGEPTTPKPNFALRGAIIETPQGNVFIRFTGPISLVQRHEEAFTGMVRTAALSASATPSAAHAVSEAENQTDSNY